MVERNPDPRQILELLDEDIRWYLDVSFGFSSRGPDNRPPSRTDPTITPIYSPHRLNFISFFALAHGTLEVYSMKLIHDRAVSREAEAERVREAIKEEIGSVPNSSGALKRCLDPENMSQSQRSTILRCATVISESTVENMDKISNIRHDLVHNPRSWSEYALDTSNVNELRDPMRTAIETVDTLAGKFDAEEALPKGLYRCADCKTPFFSRDKWLKGNAEHRESCYKYEP